MPKTDFLYAVEARHQVGPEVAPLLKYFFDRVDGLIDKVQPSIEHNDFLIVKKLTTFELLGLLNPSPERVISAKGIVGILLDDAFVFLNLKHHPEYLTIYYTIFAASIDKVKQVEARIKETLSPYLVGSLGLYCGVQWYYFSEGDGIDYYNLTELFDDIIHPQAYPYISDIEEMIQDYLKSEESILLLIGPPGTGKTRLIRYIIQKMLMNKERERIERDQHSPLKGDNYGPQENYSVSYTTDAHVIRSDDIFMSLLSSRTFGLVLEDIDYHLKDRKKEDAPVMYKLLGASSGLIRNISKKIFLSTNLDDVKDIDEALLRPGRCFATIRTRKLSGSEAVDLAKVLNPKCNTKVFEKHKDYSLAHIYKYINTGSFSGSEEPRKIGF